MDSLDNSHSEQQERASPSGRPSLNGKSPIKPILSASSPARSVSMSDYSPMKGSNSISSFFTPPVPLRPSSLSTATSPQRQPVQAVVKSSPGPQSVAISSLVHDTKAEDSESDLTLSEGDDESESFADVLNTASETESVDVKPALSKVSRSIPFALNEEVDESVEGSSESESESESESVDESLSSSDSEVSLIISLPSTDSNEAATRAVPSRKYSDYSASDYETNANKEEEDDAADIPISIDSDSEEGDPIPVMVFDSKQIALPESPEKKPPSPRRKQSIESTELLVASAMPVLDNYKSSGNYTPLSPKRRALDPEQLSSVRSVDIVKPVENVRPVRPVDNATAVNMAAYQMKFNTTSPALFPSAISSHAAPVAPTPAVARGLMFAKDYVAKGPAFKPKTGYVYDERMLHHFDPHDSEHPEKPARITSIYEKLRDANLLEKSLRIPIQVKLAEFSPEVQSVHDPKYCRMINQTSLIRNLEELQQISSQFNSVYINPSTAISATVAAAATIELCQAIGKGEVENGFAIVRPPGHHAEHDEAMGFCIYNNVAVAASSLLRRKLASRILILDWDVHHGNGTQNAFNESGDVLYVSLHRYDGAKFYPHIEEANYTYVGSGTAGLGK